jgi:hypothetical protein
MTDEDEIPLLVARLAKQHQQSGASYEEANWAKLSPAFRTAHNRLRQTRGLPTLPPPAVDLYVPPQARVRKFDPSDPEFVAEAKNWIRGEATMLPRARGDEGYTINGSSVQDAELAGGLKQLGAPALKPNAEESEGFSVNGARIGDNEVMTLPQFIARRR